MRKKSNIACLIELSGLNIPHLIHLSYYCSGYRDTHTHSSIPLTYNSHISNLAASSRTRKPTDRHTNAPPPHPPACGARICRGPDMCCVSSEHPDFISYQSDWQLWQLGSIRDAGVRTTTHINTHTLSHLTRPPDSSRERKGGGRGGWRRRRYFAD